MSNIEVKLNTSIDKVIPTDKQIEAALKPTLEAAVKEFEKQVSKGFEKEAIPGGSKWKPLSPSYALWKKSRGGGKTLELSGRLKAAATSPQVKIGDSDSDQGSAQGGGTSLTATLTVTGVPYARSHQFGRGNIPARPFFTVEGQAEQAITKAVKDAFYKAIKP